MIFQVTHFGVLTSAIVSNLHELQYNALFSRSQLKLAHVCFTFNAFTHFVKSEQFSNNYEVYIKSILQANDFLEFLYGVFLLGFQLALLLFHIH